LSNQFCIKFRCTFTFLSPGEGKPINAHDRQLFNPTDTPRVKKAAPSVEGLVESLYPSCQNAAVFQYIYPLFQAQPNYGPDADVNLGHEEEVFTSTQLPKSISDIASDAATAGENFLRLPTYSSEEVEAVEKLTQGQSSNEHWKKYRVGVVTASVIHNVKTKVETVSNPDSKRSKGTDDLVNQMCLLEGGPNPNLFNLKYGREMEEPARKKYIAFKEGEGHVNINVQTSGLILSKQHSFIAASPDGIVTCDCCNKGLVELKCVVPKARKRDDHTNVIPMIETVEYLHKPQQCTKYQLRRSHKYYSQIQTQIDRKSVV
jgi:hypothetical protein